MKKLTKSSTFQEIQNELHYFLLQKEGFFTLQSAYDDFIILCEQGIDTKVVIDALMDTMDRLMDDGLIRLMEENLYCSTLSKDHNYNIQCLQHSKSTL